ncbi:MAG: hypothetical protein LBR61_01645 [Synergistaceae bacterium]|nr:hypothetical protein [Synergistaceae bacterium]
MKKSRLPALLAAITLLSLLFPALSLSVETPEEVRLSADRMRFDAQSGDFLATGGVLVQAEGLTLMAPRGTGNVQTKDVYFTEGIVASGDWRGDWIDLKAGAIELHFAQTPTYTAEGKVEGVVGKLSIDADKLYMKGSDISALNVRRLEDLEAGIAFGAGSVRGTLTNGVLTSFTAQKKVWLQGRPSQSGDMVDLRGDMAVYSIERGSVVLSGNVRAVQKGRTLTAPSLVYFPANNRVEAIGGGYSEAGSEKERVTITIDLKQEKQEKKQ